MVGETLLMDGPLKGLVWRPTHHLLFIRGIATFAFAV